MSHSPRIRSVSGDGSLTWVMILFERVGSACPFACEELLVDRFVTLGLCVKGALRNGWQTFLLRLVEILAVCSPFGLAGHRIIVGLQNVFDEVNDRIRNFSFSTTVGKVW